MNNPDQIGDYYLVLSELKNLTESEKDQIHAYYRDMLNYYHENFIATAQSIFNTLDMAGLIKNRTQEEREKKLDYICG
jgi:hypothetical protein